MNHVVYECGEYLLLVAHFVFFEKNPAVLDNKTQALFPQKPHVGLDWLQCNARKSVFLCTPSRTFNIIHCFRRISRREKILHGRERHLVFTIRWLNNNNTKCHCWSVAALRSFFVDHMVRAMYTECPRWLQEF